MVFPIHPLQISVLELLRTANQPLRFSELKPAGIDSDVINYHIKYLIKSNIVQKIDNKYNLTNYGIEYIADIAPLKHGKPQLTKIAAMCIVLNIHQNSIKLLYQKRNRKPHAGSYLMVAGGVKRGEPILLAAERRLLEEANMTAKMAWLGSIRKIRINPDDEKVWSDITYHLCYGFVDDKNSPTTKYGEHVWLSLEHAVNVESEQIVGSKYLSKLLLKLKNQPIEKLTGFYVEEIVSHAPF